MLNVLFILIGMAVFAFLVFKSIRYKGGYFDGINVPGVIGAVLALLGFITVGRGFGEVAAGNVGVLTRFGAVTGRTIPPGLYLVNPLTDNVEHMDCQTHAYKAPAAAASKDLQNVSTEITLNYQLMPQSAAEVYTTMRREYGSRVMVPTVQEAVKSVTAKYDAVQLITQREQVRTEIENAVRGRLESHGIRLDQLSITNFAFDKEFAQAIESKVVATQLALKAENDLKRVKMEAEQRIAEARGEAEAIRIQAQAIVSQGGAAYVQLKAIEKWQGQVPQWVTGTNSVPFINLTKQQ